MQELHPLTAGLTAKDYLWNTLSVRPLPGSAPTTLMNSAVIDWVGTCL